MKKLLLPFLFSFLFLWLFGGACWIAANQKKTVSPIVSTIDPVGFSFVDGAYELAAKGNFSFFQSSAEPFISEQLNYTLLQIAKYCNSFPSKKILIEGFYQAAEENKSALDNLGLARAESIKSRLIRLGLKGDRITTGGKLNQQLKFEEGVANNAVEIKVIPKDPISENL